MNQDSKSAATSNCILIVVVIINIAKPLLVILKTRLCHTCEENPLLVLTLTVHKAYNVSNFISFIENVISLYPLSRTVMRVLHDH